MNSLYRSLRGLVFLGTPHPGLNSKFTTESLDAVLCSSLQLSKKAQDKAREDVALAWQTSVKFEEIAFPHPVISGFEEEATKVNYGFFKTKRTVVWACHHI